MNNKGFTLIELIGVVVILAVILLLTRPIIGTVMTNSRKSAFEIQVKNLAALLETEKLKDPSIDIESITLLNLSNYVEFDTSNFASLTVTFSGERILINVIGNKEYDNLKACGTKKQTKSGTIDDLTVCN